MSKTALAEREPTNIAQLDDTQHLMRMAIEQGEAGVAALERLVAMRERAEDRANEKAFNIAMSAAQSEMGRISADATNNQTRSNYATYGKLDRVLRPIYTRHKFALSFGTEPSESADVLMVFCDVTHEAGHTRRYRIPMPADGKGAKGGDVMTKTHATGSAASYGMRYLLKLIFNVAIGEEDDDGVGANAVTAEQAATLKALAEEVGADIPRFLKWARAESFADIAASRYATAVKMLEAKR